MRSIGLSKLQYRRASWDVYRRLAGRNSLPKEAEYWTLCYRHDKCGELDEASELAQLLREGFVSPDQFHGVDRDPEIIRRNKLVVPEAHWHTGEFAETVVRRAPLRAGFVHFDSEAMPPNLVSPTRHILKAAETSDHGVLVVVNTILRRKRYDRDRYPSEWFPEALRQFHSLDQWSIADIIYHYHGSGPRARTELGTYFFWRDPTTPPGVGQLRKR